MPAIVLSHGLLQNILKTATNTYNLPGRQVFEDMCLDAAAKSKLSCSCGEVHLMIEEPR